MRQSFYFKKSTGTLKIIFFLFICKQTTTFLNTNVYNNFFGPPKYICLTLRNEKIKFILLVNHHEIDQKQASITEQTARCVFTVHTVYNAPC